MKISANVMLAPALLLALVAFGAGCTDRAKGETSAERDVPGLKNELRAPVPVGKAGIPDDSIRPVARGGIPDDSIRPVAKGGVPDDSVKPATLPKPLPAAPAPAPPPASRVPR